MTPIEDRFIREMGPDLRANNIEVLRESKAIDVLLEACFPLELGRLDWSLFPGRVESTAKTVSAWYGVDHDQACRHFLRETIAIRQLRGRAYFINDQMDIALAGDVESFAQIFDRLMWPHGHIYLFGEGGDWCLNVTLDDDFYFGYAPPRVLSG